MNDIDSIQLENQRRLNDEKRKNVLLEDEVTFLKQELDKKKNEIKSIIGDKDALIMDMKREMSSMSRTHMNSLIIQ
jgi:hypothetical protein